MKIFIVSFSDCKEFKEMEYPFKIKNVLESYFYCKNNIEKKYKSTEDFNNRFNKEGEKNEDKDN